MDKYPWLAAEVKVYGLYGAQVKAWAARKARSCSGVGVRSTAPRGRGRGWPEGRYAWVRLGGAAAFFRAFAGAVEGACGGRGVVDVVSDYGVSAPAAEVHDDGWTPSPLHVPRPASPLMAELAAGDGLRLAAVRFWSRTISSGGGEAHANYTRNAVLCILEARQAELLAESLRRFAEMF